MKKKAIIISIKGYKLSKKEKSLLANERPWGLILFKRNIKSLKQIKKLIQTHCLSGNKISQNFRGVRYQT